MKDRPPTTTASQSGDSSSNCVGDVFGYGSGFAVGAAIGGFIGSRALLAFGSEPGAQFNRKYIGLSFGSKNCFSFWLEFPYTKKWAV